MNPKSCLVSALLALLPALCLPQPAATPRSPLYWWLATGVGRSSVGFLAGSTALCVQARSLLVSARGTANASQSLCEEYYDFGLAAGYVWHSHTVRVGAGTGWAVVTGAVFGGWPPCTPWGEWVKKGPVLGMSLEGQLQVLLSSFLALGLYWYADLNGLAPFTGVTVTLILGRLR